jgi:hypothetical protein
VPDGDATGSRSAGRRGRLEFLSLLFAGLEPNQLFGKVFSVDMSELILVFGTIALSILTLVAFEKFWWSR